MRQKILGGYMAVLAEVETDILCADHERLRGRLAHAIKSLVNAQVSYSAALRIGDSRVSGFERNLEIAAVEWKIVRQSYEQHVREHGC